MPDQPAPNHAGNDARFTVELASVLTGARRRALRDGDRQIDTAHLLHSLIETDPEVREAFDGGPQLAKVLGYLVQRSIGYGLRWQGSVEDTGAVPVVRAPAVDGWSPSALAAMEDALYRAASRGEVRRRPRSARRAGRRHRVPCGGGALPRRRGRAVAGGPGGRAHGRCRATRVSRSVTGDA